MLSYSLTLRYECEYSILVSLFDSLKPIVSLFFGLKIGGLLILAPEVAVECRIGAFLAILSMISCRDLPVLETGVVSLVGITFLLLEEAKDNDGTV